MPGPPGPPIVAAAASPPQEMNQAAAVAVEAEQEMDQDNPAVKQPSTPRKANVVNRMDPGVWHLVPYVSLSSDEDTSDEEGKFPHYSQHFSP